MDGLYFKTTAQPLTIAALNGPALTIRRFMIAFPEGLGHSGKPIFRGSLPG